MPSNLKMIGSIRDSISAKHKQISERFQEREWAQDGYPTNSPTMNVAKVLKDPANPAIMDVNTRLSSGPGLPNGI